jgi:hypothetical protein
MSPMGDTTRRITLMDQSDDLPPMRVTRTITQAPVGGRAMESMVDER